ncbi:TonB-dependent receptor [Sphingomonas sp.]|uniref:TonB-dependent receptor n=1 Tax=Sphingomonas sp. TaxID=28214 RepID=UPI001EBAFE55|nr:TonB-dependent receptor [Sphingomonas sp.]MBX3593315.1 TonB-dependent receptor [Sphingomonas sp.]
MTTNKAIRRPLSLRDRGAAAALGMAVVLAPLPASAKDQGAQDQGGEVELDTLKIEDRTADVNPNAEPGAPYKARTSGDERLTRPIAELPQTMAVLTKKQIDDSGYTDLVRILDAQPGITVGTGENGNAFGDRYIIRGQEARSDVFVDGLRDPGMTTRESFAVDQVEISKGPNSTFAGRGTAGGAVNLITKHATTDYDFTTADIGIGTDRYIRATLDTNLVVSDQLAVRANLLYGYTNIPDRKPADRKREGLAVSATYAPVDTFDLTLDYYGLRAYDNADLGDYLSGDATTGDRKPVRTPAYAQAQDFQKSDVDTVTARLDWRISDHVKLTNRARYGTSFNGYVVTGARGATTGAANPGGAYPTITFSTHQGWQDVDYFANQANLHIEGAAPGGRNDLILGVEYTDHRVLNGVYAIANTGAFNCVTGAAAALNNYCGIGGDGRPVANLNTLLARQITRSRWDQDWHMKTVSAYLMDTIDVTPDLTLFGGVRYDHFSFDLDLQDNSLAVTRYAYDGSFWNGHLGVTYKLGERGMVYASAATSADVNCGESDVGTNAGYGGCLILNGTLGGGRPERSVNLELGTKLNLFDEKLLLTAALFQTTKHDVFEASGGGYTPTGTGNTGKNRVRGIELGVSGNITRFWSMQAGLTLMDAEILESASNPANVGKTLSNFADFQASLLSRFQATDRLALGFAIKHKSKRYGGQPDTAPGYITLAGGGFVYSQPVPAYTVGDVFAEYRVSRNIDLRLNVNNLTDETYYLAGYRSGTFLYRGDARQVVATVGFRF